MSAGDLLGQVAAALGGRGGGRADLAQGGAPTLDGAEAAFAAAREWLRERLAGGRPVSARGGPERPRWG